MMFIHKKQCVIFFIVIISILIQPYNTQTTTEKFRSSNIELVPNFVVLNSISTVDFFCINHQPENLPLHINLSKNISNDHINITTDQLNITTKHIRIQLKNYIGMFHLLCHAEGKQNKGTRADIIAKAESGIVQLIEPCRVYDRQYIKCIIYASTMARAIQNDFPNEFEFTESSDVQSYSTKYDFLKNESTDKYLVFKWLPTVGGEFPNGVIMNMKIILPYFGTTFYRFNMTPIFVIKPNFVLQNLSKNKIQIQFTTMSSPAICEKSIVPKTNFNINKTWTPIESKRNTMIIELLCNTTYEICIKCRQTLNNTYAFEECKETKTSNQCNFINLPVIIIPIIIVLCLIILLISTGIYSIYQRKQISQTIPSVIVQPATEDLINTNNEGTDFSIEPENDSSESNQLIDTKYTPMDGDDGLVMFVRRDTS